MQNTLENKTKFFAAHFGQEVRCSEAVPGPLFKINYEALRGTTVDVSFLLLTPLSSIALDDARAVAKIINCYHTGIDLQIESHTKQMFGKTHKWVRVFYTYEEKQHIVFNVGDDGISHNKGAAYFEQWSSCLDYLRSKGYALQWMDMSIEELISRGWIKLKKAQDHGQD